MQKRSTGPTTTVSARLTVSELETVEAQAKKAGLTRADWIRMRLRSEPVSITVRTKPDSQKRRK